MEITWGVPTATRTVKEERFTTPVVSLVAITASKAARKFTFNKAAKEALGLTDYCNVMLGFSEGKLVVKNLGNLEEGEEVPYGAFTVTKSMTFSDKKIFEHIIKLNNLDIAVENHIHLGFIEGQPFMIQTSIESDTVTAEDVFKSDEEIAVSQAPVAEAVVEKPTVKAVKTIKPLPEVKAEAAPERVKFAIDNTEEEPVISPVDEEEEW